MRTVYYSHPKTTRSAKVTNNMVRLSDNGVPKMFRNFDTLKTAMKYARLWVEQSMEERHA